jgi:hypothetical protein
LIRWFRARSDSASRTHAGATHKYSFDVSPSVAGQIVRIQLRSPGILSLAEVGVFPPQ